MKDLKIGDEVFFYEYGHCGDLIIGNVKAVDGDTYIVLSHCNNEWIVDVDCLFMLEGSDV
jgi:predicted RNA-binding protein with PUA-like domain